MAESRTYAKIFLAKWSPTDKKKSAHLLLFLLPFFSSLPPFSFSSSFSFFFFLLTPSLVLYDCLYLTRNKYNLQFNFITLKHPLPHGIPEPGVCPANNQHMAQHAANFQYTVVWGKMSKSGPR